MGIALIGVLASCGGNGSEGTKTGPAAAEAGAQGVLFTLSAKGGTLQATGHGKTGVLSLRAPDSKVTAFADRPARLSGMTTLEEFVDHGWKAVGLDRDPPNAALVLDHAPQHRDTAVFELSGPSYSRARRTLSFRATPVGKVSRGAMPVQDLAQPPSDLGRSHLFIDAGDAGGVRFGSAVRFKDDDYHCPLCQ
jgi:hypothetical protein